MSSSESRRESTPDDAELERVTVCTQTLDVERQGFLGVRDRVLEVVALSVQARQLGRVDVIAALVLGLEDELDVGVRRQAPSACASQTAPFEVSVAGIAMRVAGARADYVRLPGSRAAVAALARAGPSAAVTHRTTRAQDP